MAPLTRQGSVTTATPPRVLSPGPRQVTAGDAIIEGCVGDRPLRTGGRGVDFLRILINRTGPQNRKIRRDIFIFGVFSDLAP